MTPGEPMLRARGVDVHFGGTWVLRRVGIGVEAGEVLGVLGPTGAGKTTLFRVLVGEQRAQRGEVWLGGEVVTGRPLWARARRGLGYMPQTPSVLPELTVEQNLVTYEALTGSRPRGASYWAQRVGLEHRLEVGAGALSGGERRRLELARVLVGMPRVLVADEPFSGLDPVAAGEVATLLRAEADRGLAVILADHHATIALGICDRGALLWDGGVQVEGTPAELQQHPLVRQRYLG